MVNFALPSKGFASFTLSKLRLAFLHEAQNFLNHMTFLIQNSRFKIQNELNLRVVSKYSQVFCRADMANRADRSNRNYGSLVSLRIIPKFSNIFHLSPIAPITPIGPTLYHFTFPLCSLITPIIPIIPKFPINNRSCPLLPKPTNGRARYFARGKASGHIPRRGGGLGVGQAWKCLPREGRELRLPSESRKKERRT